MKPMDSREICVVSSHLRFLLIVSRPGLDHKKYTVVQGEKTDTRVWDNPGFFIYSKSPFLAPVTSSHHF
jgi:hypothetical protein